jgi:hypothetical protein
MLNPSSVQFRVRSIAFSFVYDDDGSTSPLLFLFFVCEIEHDGLCFVVVVVVVVNVLRGFDGLKDEMFNT